MYILDVWKNNRDFIINKNIEQIVSMCGDGKLKDGGACSKELRSLLEIIPSDLLSKYTEYCLSNSFKNSGLVLQDLINQVGVRLGLDVIFGNYKNNNDGLWTLYDGFNLVVEVKTTDIYNFSLEDTVIKYRNNLIEKGSITNNKSSILIVVGREDTGGLEKQIKGSNDSHHIRLISVDSLFSILHLKENFDDDRIFNQIYEIFKPYDFTKIDKLIDIVFETHKQTEKESNISLIKDELDKDSIQNLIINEFSQKNKVSLIKKSKAFFSDINNNYGILTCISKKHDRQSFDFWFTITESQEQKIKNSKFGFISLTCLNEEIEIYNIPYSFFAKLRPMKDGKRHIHINSNDRQKVVRINGKKIDITEFKIIF